MNISERFIIKVQGEFVPSKKPNQWRERVAGPDTKQVEPSVVTSTTNEQQACKTLTGEADDFAKRSKVRLRITMQEGSFHILRSSHTPYQFSNERADIGVDSADQTTASSHLVDGKKAIQNPRSGTTADPRPGRFLRRTLQEVKPNAEGQLAAEDVLKISGAMNRVLSAIAKKTVPGKA